MKQAKGYRRSALPWDPLDRYTLRYWHYEQDRLVLLEQIKKEVQAAGWKLRLDSGWGGWDMEIYGSRYVKVQLVTATEHHHGVGKLTRVRVVPQMSKFCMVLLVAASMLTLLLLAHLWPFSRPAVLIPLAVYAMYLVNRRKVIDPVVGLIDEAAAGAGFYPVPAEKKD